MLSRGDLCMQSKQKDTLALGSPSYFAASHFCILTRRENELGKRAMDAAKYHLHNDQRMQIWRMPDF
jgi:hypothetical protein